MKAFLLIVPAMALLSACTTPEEKCTDYGFTPGTSDFAACSMYISEQKSQARRVYFQNLGQQLGSTAGSIYAPAPLPNQPTGLDIKRYSYTIDKKTYYCSSINGNVTCQ